MSGSCCNEDDELAGETYDADGNVLASGGKSFAYDSEDRLKSMNGGAVNITYDGDGNRFQKIANGVVTKYLVDDLNPTGYPQVVEETGSNVRTYTYGLQRIDENQVINGAQTPSFYGYDGAGNVRQLENSAGAITDTYEYDAFGDEIASTGTTPNNYLYRGEQWDPDLGLYYLRARYYNPITGRFISRDPEEGKIGYPKTLHKYSYTEGNPIGGADPSGRADLVEYAIGTGRVAFNLYNTFSPAFAGSDFAQCTDLAISAEAEDLNAAILGMPIPISGAQIATSLGKCDQKAIANLIKGPWGLIF